MHGSHRIRAGLLTFLLAGFCLLPSIASTAQLDIAAASDLRFALDELAADFHTRQPDIRIQPTYGSSGNFFAQLRNQAPFDLYLSADIEYPKKLAALGLALDSNVFPYAIGRLALWVPKSSPLNLDALRIRALLAPTVKRIAIANPRHAPYGVAAVAAMKSLGVYDQAESRLVYGENIAQAAQFVESGAAEAGIIALSLALAPPLRAAGRHWELPLDAYPQLLQGGLILKTTQHPDLARLFRDFILGPHGRDVLRRHGFALPDPR